MAVGSGLAFGRVAAGESDSDGVKFFVERPAIVTVRVPVQGRRRWGGSQNR